MHYKHNQTVQFFPILAFNFKFLMHFYSFFDHKRQFFKASWIQVQIDTILINMEM